MTENRVVLDWGTSWTPVAAKSPLDNELMAELKTSHPLRAMNPTVFGRCLSCDDVVAAVVHAAGEPELAVVHLTWQGRDEGGGRGEHHWPHFERLTTHEFTQRFLRGGEHL